MRKILFITFYFGELPWYFNYFYKSCLDNKDVDFIFFGDQIDSSLNAENIKVVDFSIEKFNLLASEKLGFKINVKRGYKICDFRPAFGNILEQYITEYDFWAICDMDIVFGNIRGFLTDEVLNEYDFISVKPEYPAGYMSVFKNTDLVNSLYKKSPHYKFIFQEERNYMFDECAGCYSKVISGINILDTNSDTDSIHHLLELNKDKINSIFEYFSIEGMPGNIKYDNGILIYKNKYEVLIYHLSDYKKNLLSDKSACDFFPNKFFITKYSISISSTQVGINKIKDFLKLLKFSLLKSLDRILLLISPKKLAYLNEGFYSHMNHSLEIREYSGLSMWREEDDFYNLYQSYLFPDFAYLKQMKKYAKLGKDFMEIYDKNGNPFTYERLN
ncbi:DUF6625 family protein [uncultured Chryseobacterium sp.]|uniref:DUF6625 family protein n=2 Tax=uncultured Chryseobacterium sp. TaxID=259322 RepID=UPI0025DB39EC|nr:DUF6625 family protein [uncultured Chryseobacterium sp.]